MKLIHKIPKSIFWLRCFTIFILLLSYPLALYAPVQIGWENHLIENLQLAVLFSGFLVACYFAKPIKNKSIFWLAVIAMPLWFIIFMREISWGATLLHPLYTHEITGPVWSSSTQLFYKPVVYPLLLIILMVVVILFFMTKQYKTITKLCFLKSFPLFEFCFLLVGALISTAAEGHMGLSLPLFSSLNEGQIQIIEESAELCGYMALFTAQLRCFLALANNY